MGTNVYFPTPRTTGATKALWGAIAVLGISTLAMGAALVQVHVKQDNALAPSGATAVQQASAETNLPAPTSTRSAASRPPQSTKPVAPATTKPTTEAAATATTSPGYTAPPAQGNSAPMRTVVSTSKPVCQACGTVESVTVVQREANPNGIGAVAGAVLGGIVGNQVGQGDGKTVATILGMLGGGWAGNTVEKKMKVETVYQVDVRMDDGTTRTIEQKTAPAVGAKVTVDGNTISPAAAQTNNNDNVNSTGI